MEIPNFDNTDLAIFAIALIELPVLILGMYKSIDPVALLGFGALGVTGIVGLAKTKPNGKEGVTNGEEKIETKKNLT